jgi:hypothetical protein
LGGGAQDGSDSGGKIQRKEKRKRRNQQMAVLSDINRPAAMNGIGWTENVVCRKKWSLVEAGAGLP